MCGTAFWDVVVENKNISIPCGGSIKMKNITEKSLSRIIQKLGIMDKREEIISTLMVSLDRIKTTFRNFCESVRISALKRPENLC
jgi:hypothetical protein